ncbi:Uncharacterised protein [Mycobacteroides abscessus subsp. massiliense]|uniref:hypothetical protein n=1 Tax=Mycobacteroides abscessus TaxID=36809 RepID=UPI0009A7BCD3|nr:hypothetical protein [Mycobacteroides abscessus]SKY04488.1 Uncharacterised protein [Mycobacteroides abscessus subsp. massiliense]SKZ05721.1 Uncharacterised protein [Mycobacteroides abscessus subsp. massiliense]
MSDEPSDAQKLIAEVVSPLLYRHRVIGKNCTCGKNVKLPSDSWYARHMGEVLAAEVDKALGGLDRAWAAVWPDDSYLTPWHEKWNFHPNKSARELAEVDVADHEGTTLGSRWSSGWTVTE